ncbi:MAG: ATP-binding protein, partial [Bacteroidota bacterium]
MSNVAKTGPKGYEYQYEVSLLIALHQMGNQKTELYIENVGIEDAFLKVCKNHSIQDVEIQVKREKKLLSLDTLTQWLYHFEERGSTQNLLQKIIDGSIALFVTQSRCSDDNYMLKQDISNFEIHQSVSFPDKLWEKKFLKYLSENSFSSKKTSLAEKRNELCQKQKDYLSKNETLREIIQRVIIWEEVEHSNIGREIETILNQKFKIPQSLCSSIRRELCEKITEGRDSGKDVIPSIEDIIQKNQPGRPLLDDGKYIARSIEKELIEKLSKDNILLLTGHSFCGKTTLAKKIASHFFDSGFSYKITDDIQSLEEFFNQNINEDKIAILEDVWGHIEIKESFYEIKRKIEQLAGNLHKHHKLILTSRKEILQEVLNDDEGIAQYEWHDLTINKTEDLVKYWMSFTSRKDFPISVTNIFSEYLSHSKNETSLQIGEVEYLSNYNIKDLEGKSIEEILQIARHQSKDIAFHLRQKNNNAARFLSILALC